MAYASLLSLTQTLDRIILHPPPDQSPLLRLQTEQQQQITRSLHEKANLLLSFLEESSHSNSEAVRDLEGRIRDASYEAELMIESYLLVHHKKITKSHLSKHEDLQRVLQQLDSISDEVMKKREELKDDHVPPTNSTNSFPAGSTSTSNKSSMVGYDGYLKEIKERLTNKPSSKREIISIVGMGGMGKTTLARHVYDELSRTNHFDYCGWITVSQKYHVLQMVTGLLNSSKHQTDGAHHDDIGKLFEQLHKSLKGKRYLVVMDDVWDIKAWEDVRRVFPDDYNGSRILFTTRQSSVANSSDHSRYLTGLDLEQSWDLLQQKAFGNSDSPTDEFKKIGLEIAESCKGVPLSLVVVGGLLNKGDGTLNNWNYVAENVKSAVSNASQDEFSAILSLSYNHLPHHTRACFLYMGVLPEDYVIRKSKLTKLWVANGFIKKEKSKCLEQVAEDHLKDLIDRNLIMARDWSNDGQIKSCSIHDLMRELCVLKAKDEKFLQVVNSDVDYFPEVTDSLRHVSIQTDFNCQNTSASITPDRESPIHSVLFFRRNSPNHISLHFIILFRLIRVLDALTIRLDEFPVEVLELINLRYLALTYWIRDSFPSSIAKLCNLESLIVNPGKFKEVFNTSFLPVEIWKMPRLRHLLFVRSFLPYPTDVLCNGGNPALLESLQTLGNVINFRWTKEVLEMMPNLKKLVISYEHDGRTKWSSYCFDNFVTLQQLEILKCIFFPKSYLKYQDPLPLNFAFPTTLRKLTLSGCRVPWGNMSVVGSLPNLEVLKLKDHAFEGPVWEPIEEEFCKLKYLLIEESDLEQWNADATHFPLLERLNLRYCYNLVMIPSEFGEIYTLQEIELCECSQEVVDSAMSIQEEHKECGNENFQVVVKNEENSV